VIAAYPHLLLSLSLDGHLNSASSSVAVSFNQPAFSSNASWSRNAVTFADLRTTGQYPEDVFVDTNDTVYVAASGLNQVLVWIDGGPRITRSISYGLCQPWSLFVTTDGSIYVANGREKGQVDMGTLHNRSSTPVIRIGGACYGLFIDLKNTLYCSLLHTHQIVAKSLQTDVNGTRVVAGTGSAGAGFYMLNSSRGIFVDVSFILYVADFGNYRIQKFLEGQVNGTTVAGQGEPGTISLGRPTDVIVDGNGYLFIVDYGNDRIVSFGSDGFRCLAGCRGWGSASDQLRRPVSFSFDSYGNMLVADRNNQRIQKFLVVRSCGKYTRVFGSLRT
jgi:hypothetical protein